MSEITPNITLTLEHEEEAKARVVKNNERLSRLGKLSQKQYTLTYRSVDDQKNAAILQMPSDYDVDSETIVDRHTSRLIYYVVRKDFFHRLTCFELRKSRMVFLFAEDAFGFRRGGNKPLVGVSRKAMIELGKFIYNAVKGEGK